MGRALTFQLSLDPLPSPQATQTVASRCALFDTLYKPLNAQLERMLTEGVKQGKVLLVRAQKEGPLWPRPANCKPDGSTPAGANYTAVRLPPSGHQPQPNLAEFAPALRSRSRRRCASSLP